ncbi:MAG: phosphate ABC transporter permease subunit PstC [Candidatus Eisenbacteria bacterium]|nr:phosphate ABC transporter permease subunit PstC [Candidatus Eisenbacteria bacterium]
MQEPARLTDPAPESAPPTSVPAWTRPRRRVGDAVFKGLVGGFALAVVVLGLAMAWELLQASMPSIRAFGWKFLWTSTWDPVQEVYGALPFIYGTLVSSLLALLIAVPLALGIASFLSELAGGTLSRILGFLVELLAAVPSVIYGLWGIFVLAPLLREGPQAWLAQHLGFLPFFKGPHYGVGMMAAGLILAIMILPTISAICLEVFRAVPRAQREAALALGATRWETTRMAVFSYARSGILGAVILGLGRALGETMAVTMLIGNRPEVSASLFAPGYTMASVLANEFAEASGDLYISALIEVGLVLFGLTILLNIVARWLVWRTVGRFGGTPAA